MTGVEALQTALAAEHAAVYVYGVLGGQTSGSAQPALFGALTAAYKVHQERRDALLAMVRAADAEPRGAEPGYRVPADLGSPDRVRREALRVERSCGATYAFLVASSRGDRRRFGVDALLDSATREITFGGVPRRLPGL